MGYVIGIDVGGTSFRIGLVKNRREIKLFRKVPVRSVFSSEDPLRDLTEYLKVYLQTAEKAGICPEAVAIGFPATLDKERRRVLQAPNIPFMENLPVQETLQTALGLPVMIDRDVVFALAYDRDAYGLPDCEVLIGCYFGTGIGNAISVNGRILTGRNGTAGELGHIPVDGNYRRCGCGNEGCMETVAGGKYLAALCADEYADTCIGKLFRVHGEDGVLRQFVERMAMAVAAEINILDPDYVLIGGGVPNMEGFPREYLVSCIRKYSRKPYPAENMQLIFTEDPEDKCVIGAAICAVEWLRTGVSL